MTLTGLARLLGVSTNQVWTWHNRRAGNGFPAPIGSVIKPLAGGRKRAPFFDAMEVAAWYGDYEPMARNGKHWSEKRGEPCTTD